MQDGNRTQIFNRLAQRMSVAVVIPYLNEQEPLPLVLADLRRLAPQVRVVVVDNGSTDATPQVAVQGGAELVREPRGGYGAACQAGFRHLAADPPVVVVVLDGDHSDHIEDLGALVQPVLDDAADLVLGERVTLGDPASMPPNQRVGNWVATRVIHGLTGHRYADMGPFRALRWDSLMAMGLHDLAYGWNVEMQMKAVQHGLRVREVPVRYRVRVGESKISGTVRGTVRAGIGILRACWTYR